MSIRLLSVVCCAAIAAFAAEPDFSKVPGVIINHIPASEGRYVGSPTIAVYPDGSYAAAHDEFGPKSGYYTNAFTNIFRSEDRGATWKQTARIEGALWSTLFVHRGSLYLLGVNKEYGPVLIRKSDDNGVTWTDPKDGESGLLMPGDYHTAPVPVIAHKGRLWRGIEKAATPGKWGVIYQATMMSAPVDADLLKAENWTFSNSIARDPAWLDNTFHAWLEGNAVVRRGQMYNILRVDYRPGSEKAAIVRVSKDGKKATFNPKRDFIDFPGGAKKFSIRFDEESKRYWTLATPALKSYPNVDNSKIRNFLVLMSSRDLRKWTMHTLLLSHPDVEHHAFQYVDWLFEGDDIIAVSRTAFEDGLGGAKRAHDANFMTFHRFEDFRAHEKQVLKPLK
ncbi:MAG TPA: sialidase family protein [Candidatus Hydrogenedentes bacterium]|nr:sialidase family protein [Candidatus Hydrogenedentota bacterium]